MIKKFEFLPHTSDIKIRARGRSKNQAFESLVLGISHYVSPELKTGKRIVKRIKVAGKDDYELIYKFVEDILFLLETQYFISRKAKVYCDKGTLSAILEGTVAGEEELTMVKAPTYSDMSLKKVKNLWVLDVVLDI